MKKSLKLFGVISIFIIIIFASSILVYSIIINHYGVRDDVRSEIVSFLNEKKQNDNSSANGRQIKEPKKVIKTLYVVVEKETGEMTSLLLEILNSTSNQLLYLTIPMDTKVSFSNNMYELLKTESVMLPQIMELSMISFYFEKSSMYEMTRLIMEDLFMTSVDYYTILSTEQYLEQFVVDEEGKATPNESYNDFLDERMTVKKMKNSISEFYKTCETTFPIEEKLLYLETYEKIMSKDVTCIKAFGENKNDSYLLDQEKNKEYIVEFSN